MARDITSESWFKHQWRPTTAWVYLVICLFDFLLAPILTAVYFAKYGGQYIPWKPITLSEGGLFHISMGAILGITSWTRGQEMVHYAKSSYQDTDRSSSYKPTAVAEKYNNDSDFRDNIINNKS